MGVSGEHLPTVLLETQNAHNRYVEGYVRCRFGFDMADMRQFPAFIMQPTFSLHTACATLGNLTDTNG
jgi:hypothetical protein